MIQQCKNANKTDITFNVRVFVCNVASMRHAW